MEPSSGFVTPTSSDPGSPRVRYRITKSLPSDLISIEELVGPNEYVTLPETQETLNLREHESIFYNPFRTDTWYLSLTDFLENPVLSYSPPRIPFHPTPRGYYPSSTMSGESSMFSQSPETFLYGGSYVPSGYQSLSGSFSEATPQPIEQVLSFGTNGTKTKTLNRENFYDVW